MFLNNRTYFMTNPSGGNQYREYHQYILYRFVAQQIPQESEQDIRDVYTYSVESSAEIFFLMALQFGGGFPCGDGVSVQFRMSYEHQTVFAGSGMSRHIDRQRPLFPTDSCHRLSDAKVSGSIESSSPHVSISAKKDVSRESVWAISFVLGITIGILCNISSGSMLNLSANDWG